MTNKAGLKALKRLNVQRINKALSNIYSKQPDALTAAKIGPTAVQIKGQIYPGSIDASGVAVTNVGRPAAAFYAPVGGSVVIAGSTGGGSGGSSGGGGAAATPADISAFTTNFINTDGSHTHRAVFSAAPGRAQSLLGTDPSGKLTISNTLLADTGADIALMTGTNNASAPVLQSYRSDTTFATNISNDGLGLNFQHGIKIVGQRGTWSSSGWGKVIEMPSPGNAIMWPKGLDPYSWGIGSSSGNLYFGRSVADDNSAAVIYPMILTPTGLDLQGSAVVSNDADTGFTLGRAHIGHVGYGDYAGFAHRDFASTGNYALLQGGSGIGQTFLNAPAGQNIYHRINNADAMVMNASALTIHPSLMLKTGNYASQVTGWGLTYAGAFDARYIYTDELHAKAFIADLEQALAGGQIITKSVTILAQNFTAPAAGGTASLIVKDLPSANNMQVFQAGDVIRIRTFNRAGGGLNITDCWGTVSSYVDGPGEGEQTWTFTRSTGANAGAMTAGGVVNKDAIILDYGTSGNGFHEVNAIDGIYAENSPYSQIVTWTGHPATGKSVRSRLGNLKGIFGVANEFGLFIGNGTGPTDQYLRLSSYTNEIHNLPIVMYSGSNLFMRADTAGLNFYVQAAGSYADNTSILFRRPDTTKIFRLTGISNVGGGHEASVELNPGTTDSTLHVNSLAPGGYYANIELSCKVGATNRQWIFKQLANGVVGADFTGYLYVSDSVGVGISSPTGTLDVVRGTGVNGTAVFRGTTSASHFNYSTTEDTYIRGGKSTSLVIINDAASGNVQIAGGGGNVGIGVSPVTRLDINGGVRVGPAGQWGAIDAPSSGWIGFGANFYYSGSSAIYRSTNPACMMFCTDGFNFYTAPPGSAGNAITWNQRVQITNAGELQALGDLLVNGVARFPGGYLSVAEAATPATSAVYGILYIDSADGDLKVKFKNGTVKTLATN